jgi:predicted AlkP superfamily phosphohydrolase/phosphomutase
MPPDPRRPAAWRTGVALLVALALRAAWHNEAGGVGTDPARAYIGPGAGIAVVGSLFTLLLALLSAFAALLTWPIRAVWRVVRGRRALRKARVRRVIVLGLDGLEPTLTERFIDEGLLPNLKRLRDMGSYTRLGTTCPPLSPVAWSSFSTGVNPGKHNIFDFIARNPADYRPTISSVRIREPRRKLKLGRYVIPISAPRIAGLRRSKPFWSVLGEHGIFSAVLRVPITFPPDKFRGVQLAAMCVPDLRGTQGMFSYFVEQGEAGSTMEGDVGGDRILVQRRGRDVQAYLRGPLNSLRRDRPELRMPFTVTTNGSAGAAATLVIDGQRVALPLHAFSDWVRVSFPAAPTVSIHGICRFFLKRYDAPFELYCTPLQIDPDKPVMPISHPSYYSTYLARSQGPFSTLGLAEDTWSLSEKVLDEDAFLAQAYDIHAERERMFFDALDRVRTGLVTCVFDAPDRVQHMFWRFLDDRHPAVTDAAQRQRHNGVIRDMYVKMDALVGRVLEQLDAKTALFVMSDHGFNSFRRGVDLNAWLRDAGYLKLKNGASTAGRAYLADIDWSATRAYAIGLAGIFINQRGREAHGAVAEGEERQQLIAELAGKLTGLRDAETGETAIHEALPRGKAYKGPYVAEAPDLIIGYGRGYRVSWDAAIGKCGRDVFSDNMKAWSGDHCIHPGLIPGVLFSNLKLADGGDSGPMPNIIDLAPSILALFGIDRPDYMDGRVVV